MSSSPTGVTPSQLADACHPVISSAARGADVPAGLLQALAHVPDPRARRGVRHAFTAVLAVSVCAVLAGARSYAAIAEWAADVDADQRQALGLRRRAPDAVTIWRVLTALDPRVLDAVIGGWIAGCLAERLAGRPRREPGGKPARRVVAVDGKTIRGARDHTDPGDRAPHLMACLDHQAGVVLAQVAVDGKTNEIPMFTTVLDRIEDLTGVLVTADAMHAQREHADYLHGRGAHYLLTVKRNQPTLHAHLKRLPWKEVPVGHQSHDRAHGRLENRTVKVVTVTAGAGGIPFPHAAQAIQITRRTRRLKSKKWQTETVYAVTSLTAEQAQPGQLATWIRGHWKIENQLHWVRDVTYAEDASHARTGTGPHVMASLRNLAISIHRLTGATNIAAATRHAARRPHRPLAIINGLRTATLQ